MNSNLDDNARRISAATNGVVWMLAAQICVFVLTGLAAYSKYGTAGVATAAISGAICLIPAAVALYCVALTTGTPNALGGTMISMALRTALPFIVTILLVQAVKPLADTGLFVMVLINYLVVLSVESALAVRMIQTLAPPAVRQ